MDNYGRTHRDISKVSDMEDIYPSVEEQLTIQAVTNKKYVEGCSILELLERSD